MLCFAGTPGYTSAFNLCCLYSYVFQRVCTSAAYPQHVRISYILPVLAPQDPKAITKLIEREQPDVFALQEAKISEKQVRDWQTKAWGGLIQKDHSVLLRVTNRVESGTCF